MKAKILRDTTIDGLAEKINREFENSKAPFLQQVCTQYKTAVVPKMRGKEIVGHEVEYSALIFIEEVGETKKPEKEAMRQQESWILFGKKHLLKGEFSGSMEKPQPGF